MQQCVILIPVIPGEHEAQEIIKGCTAGESLGEGGRIPNGLYSFPWTHHERKVDELLHLS